MIAEDGKCIARHAHLANQLHDTEGLWPSIQIVTDKHCLPAIRMVPRARELPIAKSAQHGGKCINPSMHIANHIKTTSQ
jgi:hypothetical protein